MTATAPEQIWVSTEERVICPYPFEYGRSVSCTRTNIHDAVVAERDRCHERLEISHKYVMPTEGSDLVRVEIPMDERAKFPDAIRCRDATIELMEDHVNELKAERDGLRWVLQMYWRATIDWGAQSPDHPIHEFARDALKETE